MKFRKSMASPPGGERAPEIATRRPDGNRTSHNAFFDARKGGKGAFLQYRGRLPARPGEVQRVRPEAKAVAGGGEPGRFGGFSRQPVPGKAGKQDGCAGVGYAAQLLPLCADSRAYCHGSVAESGVSQDPADLARLPEA